jgi:hypothetical protein
LSKILKIISVPEIDNSYREQRTRHSFRAFIKKKFNKEALEGRQQRRPSNENNGMLFLRLIVVNKQPPGEAVSRGNLQTVVVGSVGLSRPDATQQLLAGIGARRNRAYRRRSSKAGCRGGGDRHERSGGQKRFKKGRAHEYLLLFLKMDTDHRLPLETPFVTGAAYVTLGMFSPLHECVKQLALSLFDMFSDAGTQTSFIHTRPSTLVAGHCDEASRK